MSVVSFSFTAFLQPNATHSEKLYTEQEQKNIGLTKAWMTALNNQDWDTFDSFLDESLKWMTTLEREIFAPSFPDHHSEILDVYTDERMVVVIGNTTANNTDSLRWLVKEPIAPTNKKIDYLWTGILTWENEKIIKCTVHLDDQKIRNQLGINNP